MTAYGGCEYGAARGVMARGEEGATFTIRHGQRKPQEGGVDLGTEKM